MKDNNSADTIVIGGGIVGSSIALRLAGKGQSVILLEKGRVGEEASGRNGGGVRQQDRDPAELPLAMEAIKIWADMKDELDWDVGYRRGGNVMIARSEKQFESLRSIMEREQAMGLNVEMLSPAETRSLTPTISEEFEIVGSKYCPTDGSANPLLVVKAICRVARRKGVRIREHEPVRRLQAADGRVTAAVTDRKEYQGSVFVNAAGPWARGLCNTIGLDFPTVNKKSRLLITEPLRPVLDQFVIIDEVYYRQALEGNVHIGPLKQYQMDDFDNSPILSDFIDVGRWLAKIIPFVKNVNLIRAFAGVTHFTPDAVAILDKIPGYDNLFLTAGFSGHGFCLGPIVGKLIAEWILDGQSSMDLNALRWDRFNNSDISKDFRAGSSSLNVDLPGDL